MSRICVDIMPGTLLVTKSSRKFYAIISSAVFVLAIYLWSGHPTFPPNDLDLHIGQRLTPREVAANATIGASPLSSYTFHKCPDIRLLCSFPPS